MPPTCPPIDPAWGWSRARGLRSLKRDQSRRPGQALPLIAAEQPGVHRPDRTRLFGEGPRTSATAPWRGKGGKAMTRIRKPGLSERFAQLGYCCGTRRLPAPTPDMVIGTRQTGLSCPSSRTRRPDPSTRGAGWRARRRVSAASGIALARTSSRIRADDGDPAPAFRLKLPSTPGRNPSSAITLCRTAVRAPSRTRTSCADTDVL